MLVYESYQTSGMTEAVTKIYSNKHFYIQLDGRYYESYLSNNQEKIARIIESNIAIKSPTASKEYFNNYFLINFYNITQEQVQKAHEFFIQMIRNVSDNNIYQIRFLIPTWAPNTSYFINDKVVYNNTIYKVNNQIQSSVSPDQDLVNFTAIECPADFIESWDETRTPYSQGDKIKMGEYIYKSLINDNNWNPIDFPLAWQLMSEGSQD